MLLARTVPKEKRLWGVAMPTLQPLLSLDCNRATTNEVWGGRGHLGHWQLFLEIEATSTSIVTQRATDGTAVWLEVENDPRQLPRKPIQVKRKTLVFQIVSWTTLSGTKRMRRGVPESMLDIWRWAGIWSYLLASMPATVSPTSILYRQ